MSTYRDETQYRHMDIVNYKRWLVFMHDLAWIPICVTAAYWLRFNLGSIQSSDWKGVAQLTLASLIIYGGSFWIFGCYRGIWRYASIPDLVRLAKAIIIAAPVTTLVCFLFGRLEGIPRSVLLLYPFMLLGMLSTVRATYRAIKDSVFKLDHENGTRMLLVGAGRAGEMLIRDMERYSQFIPVAFVDDDSAKQGQEVRGIRIRGTVNELPDLLDKYQIDVVLVTMPSAPRSVLDKVVETCAEQGVKCRTLPSLAELADGRIEVSRLRPVTVEDLLGREPVDLDPQAVGSFLNGKRILVTGGGGSIGSELCRQIIRHEPGLLIVVDNSEYNLYRIDQELSESNQKPIFNSVLGDVRDQNAMHSIFDQFRPQVVFHAAAYKHVPMVEDNITEGIRNNVFGTKIIADAAQQYNVETFVLISTDKTVNPTNVMGTTKRVAELYCQSLNEDTKTHFITTRFGNVLASAGSVVPLFERQIAEGGPVTVTHPEITRYFMTIPEAASLILQAGAIGKGGEIFVLDMGEPVLIRELAEKMIRLSGLQPGRDIEIRFSGLRPGEKLHEELFYAQEELRNTVHPKVLLASCRSINIDTVLNGLDQLAEVMMTNDQDRALLALKALVPEFNHNLTIEHRERRKGRQKLHVVK